MAKSRNKRRYKKRIESYSTDLKEVILAGRKVPMPNIEHGFTVKEENGYTLVHGGRKKNGWREHQVFFRSAMFDSTGKLVSIGFPKFFNYNETSPAAKEDISRVVEAFKHDEPISAENKIDGTLIIRSVIGGKVIWRTRATFDGGRYNKPVEKIMNSQYPKLLDPTYEPNSSLLFEYISADIDYSNVLVNKKNDLIFLDTVDHKNLRLSSREEKERVANLLGLNLVSTYPLEENSLGDLVKNIKWIEKSEGIVLRYANAQKLIKVKSKAYLELHRLKHQLDDKHIEQTIQEQGISSAEEWREHLDRSGADHELQEATKETAQKVFDSKQAAEEAFSKMKNEIDMLSIRCKGDRAKAVAEIKSPDSVFSSNEKDAAILLYDGFEGAAFDKLEKSLG